MKNKYVTALGKRILRSSNPSKGYTVVELLIVITITGILVALGFSGYTKNQEKQIALSAKELIISVIQEAQKQASIGRNDCDNIGVFQGVKVTLSSSSITKTPTCKNGDGTIKTTPIPNVTFNTPYTFTFLPLGNGIDFGGSTSLDIDYQVNSTTYRVNITAPGVITYKGEVI